MFDARTLVARSRRGGRLSRILLTAVLAVGLVGAVPSASLPSAQAALAKPAGPSIVRTATNGYGKFEVRWSLVSGATLYRVHVATDPGMTNVVHRSTYTSGKNRWIDGPEILEGGTYYYQVRSYNTKAVPGGYSAVTKVTTLVKPVKKPENIKVDALSPTSIKVDWDAAELAFGYTVKISKTAGGATVWSQRVLKDTTALTVTGLSVSEVGRTFFVKVTADRKMLTFRDSDTVAQALPYAEPSGSPFEVRVASYNVMKYTMEDATGRSWNSRVDEVGDLIDDMDLVGVQESTWGEVNGVRPIEQVEKHSGLKLARKPGTSTACSLNSVHILYDSAKFSLVRCGNELVRSSDSRYATWAVLKHKTTGKQMFVINTHLTTGTTSTADAARASATDNVVAIIDRENTYDEPVIVLGDLNSYHGRTTETPMSILSSEGVIGADLVADTRSYRDSASTHDWSITKDNGCRIDHVLVSEGIDVVKSTVRVTTASQAPSDHHPVIAIVEVH